MRKVLCILVMMSFVNTQSRFNYKGQSRIKIEMKRRIKELDLHGVPHSEVEMFLENFFFVGNIAQGTVITGNSKEMKDIVLSWLDQNDFYYYVPTGNLGRIEVQDNLL